VRNRLLPIGVAIAAAMAVIARCDARRDVEVVLALMAAASAAYLLAVWLVSSRKPADTRGLWLCLALALACRAPLLPVEPTLSDDIYRYVWDGRLQQRGLDPYTVVPNDPAFAPVHTDVTRKLNQPGMPTLYPPVAEWVFRGIAAVSESVIAFKLTFLALDITVMLLLWRWLARTGRSPWGVLVYAWNPLVILEIAGSGHLDSIGVLLVTISFLALGASITWLAAVALVAAMGVKFLPIVLVPLFWKRIRVRDAVFAVVFGLIVAAPFALPSMRLPVGSLSLYLEKWRFNGFFYGLAEHVIKTRWLSLLPAVAGFTVALWIRFRGLHESRSAWAWPMGAALLCMNTVYPWYLLWLVPFLGEFETLPLLVWTQSALATYYVFRVWASTAVWDIPWWVTALEFGSVAIAAIWVVIRSRQPSHEVH